MACLPHSALIFLPVIVDTDIKIDTDIKTQFMSAHTTAFKHHHQTQEQSDLRAVTSRSSKMLEFHLAKILQKCNASCSLCATVTGEKSAHGQALLFP